MGIIPAQTLKERGELAELIVACDLRRRGCKLAIPYGEDSDYDLVIEAAGSSSECRSSMPSLTAP